MQRIGIGMRCVASQAGYLVLCAIVARIAVLGKETKTMMACALQAVRIGHRCYT